MFDKVIKPNATQEKVYNDAARTIVKGKEDALSGGCVMQPRCLYKCILCSHFVRTGGSDFGR